jgi:putative tributyrin esterase
MKTIVFIKRAVLLAFMLAAQLSSLLGQAASTAPAKPQLPPNVIEATLASKLLGQNVPFQVVLPADYNAKDQTRYAVIYLLHGYAGHYDNWTSRTKIAEYAAKSRFIIVTPEGNNGWYTDSVTSPADKYESYILKELMPEVEKRYKTIADRDHRLVAGLSMGGYGAVKFGIKNPEMFFAVGSFSGALATTEFTEKRIGSLGKSVDATFGPESSDTRKANDIFALVRDSSAEVVKTLPFIYFATGTEDVLVVESNRAFLAVLNSKKVPHEYRERPGTHSWPFWDDQIREFIALADRMVKK